MNIRTEELQTSRFGLAYPKDGKLHLVMNADGSKHQMSTLLDDRLANHEAFTGEVVVQLWVRLQWFGGEQTIGATQIPAYLFPKLP